VVSRFTLAEYVWGDAFDSFIMSNFIEKPPGPVAAFNEGLHISLFNTGAGIPQTDLSRVFEQFHRVEKSRSTQYGGSGLGLSVAKRIIELHGGRIEIESEPSAWTQVNVCLPYQDYVTKGVI